MASLKVPAVAHGPDVISGGGGGCNAFDLLQTALWLIVNGMKTFRIALGVLAIIPVSLLMNHVSIPSAGYEDSVFLLAYLVLGIPIFVLNYWAWIDPAIIEFIFSGKSYEQK